LVLDLDLEVLELDLFFMLEVVDRTGGNTMRLLKRLLLICCGVRVIGPMEMYSEVRVCSSAVRKNMQFVIMARNSVAMQVARRWARVKGDGLALIPTDSHM